ncbi:MAG: hypothetical protein NC200_01390 [Candidatus Gastranaerophilales bacterium]|nr:hypothetical protein [Candidatus Gastranaerophilales bacterium]
MGMAASQARYLALSARKTNVEYEGQQINQQRLVLSNQSADLFNQMLTMSVPICPDSNDFTKLQYSWNDGINTSVLESYYQLGTPDEEFNYVVTSYHFEDVYTGQRKYMNDPQIQATKTNNFSDKKDINFTVNNISYDKKNDVYTMKLVNPLGQEISSVYRKSSQDSNRDVVEQLDFMFGRTTEDDPNLFEYTAGPPEQITYKKAGGDVQYKAVNTEDATALANLRKSYGALYDKTKQYFVSADGSTYICKDDIDVATESLVGKAVIRNKDTDAYYTDGKNYISSTDISNIKPGNTMKVSTATNSPVFSNYKAIGNCELTQVDIDMYKEDATMSTELDQILKDLSGDKGDAISYERIKNCFDPDTGDYIGGLYCFTMNGKRYFTTTEDLDQSLLSAYEHDATADNGIDSQHSKLSYYNAVYINTKVTEIKKALLETDGAGRFKTVKFEDDSVVYDLSVETITDDTAYNDAMNKYYYEQDLYDKRISDINAKTEILQAQDRQLQLQLEQLNTEQSALQTEMEACQKVVSKNIENSFKTFSG